MPTLSFCLLERQKGECIPLTTLLSRKGRKDKGMTFLLSLPFPFKGRKGEGSGLPAYLTFSFLFLFLGKEETRKGVPSSCIPLSFLRPEKI